MKENIKELNGYLIVKSPIGQWAIVNIYGKIISWHDCVMSAIQVAQSEPIGGGICH